MESFILYSVVLLWFIQLFVLFALFLLFRQFGEVYLKSAGAIERDGVAIGKALPSFDVRSLRTHAVLSSQELIREPAIIALVSPNCKPCQELLKDWAIARQRYLHRYNFILVLINAKHEGIEWVVQHMEIKEDQEVYVLKEEKAVGELQIRVTPFAYIVDGRGIVKAKGLCGGMQHIEHLLSTEDSVTFPITNKGG